MPTYVRSRLLNAREFAIGELTHLKAAEPVFRTEVIESLRQHVAFEHYCLSGVDLDGCQTGKGILLSTDMPVDMFKDYFTKNLIVVDPMLPRLTAEAPDLSWFDLPRDITEAKAVRPLIDLFETYKVPPRTVFSLWNSDEKLYGTIGFTRATPFTEAERSILKWFGRKWHDELSAVVLRGFNGQIGLSDSELKCLQHGGRGLTSEEISYEIGLTTETINSHFKSATRKLGARNRTQAITDALRLGLIS